MDLPFSHSAAKWENVLTMSANHGSDIQCLFPTVGQYTMSQSISVISGRGCFALILFLVSVHQSLLTLLFFILLLKHLITQILCYALID